MEQEKDSHEGRHLAQAEVFADQAGRRRHSGIAGHAQADGKDDGCDESLGQDKEIQGDPDSAETVEEGQDFPFRQGIAQDAR